MAVFYNKVQKKNPSKPNEAAKWYVSVRSLGMVKEKEVATQISDETTLNPKEAEMALYQLEKVLIRNLLEGKTVQLGDWGSFYLTLNSEGVATEKELSAKNIKKINLRFKPGKSLKEALEKAEFKEAEAQLGKH